MKYNQFWFKIFVIKNNFLHYILFVGMFSFFIVEWIEWIISIYFFMHNVLQYSSTFV